MLPAGMVELPTPEGSVSGELTPVSVPVAQLRRQVPEWWRTFFGRRVASVLYGAGLGVGFLTYLSHGTLVVVEPGTPLRWQNDSDRDALIFAYGAPGESNAEILER